MFNAGPGGLADLPSFSVLVRGVDDWRYDTIPNPPVIDEPRLRSAVQELLGPGVKELRPAPWLEGIDTDPNGPASRVGVPVIPFPQWFRCTRCNTLAPLDSTVFGFENSRARRPDEAHFFHPNCGNKKRLAVPARFMLACTNGHLDEFPYVGFVHKGGSCPAVSHPTLKMEDRGGNLGANVSIACQNCGEARNIREAMGENGAANLPRCRGRHPHLGTFTKCDADPKLLIVGSSNQWFGQVLSVLSVPPSGASALEAKVAEMADRLADVDSAATLKFALGMPQFAALKQWTLEEVWAAIEAYQARAAAPSAFDRPRLDLLTPEWDIFTSRPLPDATEDFAVVSVNLPPALTSLFSDVLQVERLRQVRALTGFTRLDAPDPEDPNLVVRAPLSSQQTPEWVPASEVRGEGLFLRVDEKLLADWELRAHGSVAMEAHREAYGRFRSNRYSSRIKGNFDEMYGWPGGRYIALHTLSHLLIRTIALECGYNAASLSERIYAGTESDPRGGILIYTAVPDAEGTLGGLVSLGEPRALERIVWRALSDAQACSSDPLCAERLPHKPADFLHGAACHVCLFISETACERGNRFLDRRFVVPLGDDRNIALLPEL
jgi:hypothetical protein